MANAEWKEQEDLPPTRKQLDYLNLLENEIGFLGCYCGRRICTPKLPNLVT